MIFRWPVIFLLVVGLCLAGRTSTPAQAGQSSPSQAAESLRKELVQAQLVMQADGLSAGELLDRAQATYAEALSPALRSLAPDSHQRVEAGFAALSAGLENADAARFAAGRAQVWTGILAGSALLVDACLQQGDIQGARAWLAVREFRIATRFFHPSADATLALDRFAKREIPADEARLAVRVDLYDTYQSRLNEALRALPAADASGFSYRAAELAALAEGYFRILAPAYAEQNGAAALDQARQAFALLQAAALASADLSDPQQAVELALKDFRAAPLGPDETARRAASLLRYISLVPVEYGRGVSGGMVTHDFEIQEAVTFHEAAFASFSDLQKALAALSPEKTARVEELMESLGAQLGEANTGRSPPEPAAVAASAASIHALLSEMMPEDWLKASTQGDFDVIGSLLDQVETAVKAGDFPQAESARLEAYAVMETGPEARLVILAPQLSLDIEGLFWNGQGEYAGLAALIRNQASRREVEATLARLAELLAEARDRLGQSTAPAAIAVNAGIIVFREGLEAVVILVSLLSSMRSGRERSYRRPMWVGTALAFLATTCTWFLAREVLQSLARFGEKLEAVVSLVAIGVLLVIMNWFFHKLYWTSWIAKFHTQKRRLISGEAGLMAGLVLLGFSSVYREGFETVLFLQALTLEAGPAVVLAGAAAGLSIVLLIGFGTFRLQVSLPYRRMLVITGVLIGGVLFQMVGKTVYALQIVGWAPVHPFQGVDLPYWLGMWFGLYPTWEGMLAQVSAVGFVVGSYYLAEWMQRRRRNRVERLAAAHRPAAAKE